MVMTTERIKALAGYCMEEVANPSFGLKNEDNVKTACVEIAKAGVPVDMEYFMGIFYFNFGSKKAYDKAIAAIGKKIDTTDESEFKPKKSK